jgi:prevent-host-death family protein
VILVIYMTVSVTEFKAKCLNLIDQVHKDGEPVIITKHGKVVAKLVAENPIRPIEEVRLKLAGSVKSYQNPFEPAVAEDDIEALK